MIWLKRLGYLVGAIVALLLLALGSIYVITSLRLHHRYDLAATPVTAASDSATLARGEHLVAAIGKCGECHGKDLGGSVMFDDGAMGKLESANLTSGPGGIIGRVDDATIARAIREGVRADGTPLVFMPSEGFHAMSDADVAALIAYLHTRAPVDRVHPAPKVGMVARALSLFTSFPLLPVRMIDHSVVPPKAVTEEPTEQYGKYLAQIGACTVCHGPGLNGQDMGKGRRPSQNLTRAGIGSWTEADFTRALREGKRPDGSAIDSLAMPWKPSGRMTDSEIHAVWLYLRSVPPKEFAKP